jgi:hypothetical protein
VTGLFYARLLKMFNYDHQPDRSLCAAADHCPRNAQKKLNRPA